MRKEADKAQQFATEQAKSAAEVIEHLKATVEAEVSKQDELVSMRIKHLRLPMDVAGLFFEPHPSNLERMHFFFSCKNAEIFITISQIFSELAKISVSVPSIS